MSFFPFSPRCSIRVRKKEKVNEFDDTLEVEVKIVYHLTKKFGNFGQNVDCKTMGASIMPKILEISVGFQMERSVSVSSDRNVRDHLWLEYTDRNSAFHFRQTGSLR